MTACLRYQVKGVGIEIAWWPILKALYMRKMHGLEGTLQLHCGNIKKYSLVDADIVFVYLFTQLLGKFKEKFIKELRPGARIVSARYQIPGWTPTITISTEKHPIYLYEIT
jgi:hypothetical protein